MKLHLGCGQNYLDGYVNIDFPPSEHTVQEKSIADRLEDITALRFPAGTIEEVRLHHVFEHFRRPQVTGMLACWNSWLTLGGTVHIEVPDLGRMARVFANPFASLASRAVAERHLFGSHEAGWAAHYEGYDESLLRHMFDALGFEVAEVKRQHWRGTDNIHVIGKKVRALVAGDDATVSGRRFLSSFLVDDSPGELRMLEIWLEGFQRQVAAGWATD
ncbi:hypothetical protein J8I26_09735 [Herbaspirillum sp. LeCh32-8]|uniref:class I SAM-dependent methyltransferase n=1 Tax=Herbaspirillum sp. LeCh32-8 TaxID=2821356 RepID=UPI001AE42C34|nr:hypothetical protein [Herbaspirillum sp. LeCh32-8]MBP0598384.1 hypothetical protein [Herbaspirillum sp. LeCh32-8]